MGGTQDNGTWLFSGGPEWLETIDGDGGQSGYGAEDSDIRVHTYFDATPDVSFDAGEPGATGSAIRSRRARSSARSTCPDHGSGRGRGDVHRDGEHLADPEQRWPQAFLEENCNEYTGTFQHVCGDWKPIGSGTSGNLTSTFYGRDKPGTTSSRPSVPAATPERSGPDPHRSRVRLEERERAPTAGELPEDRYARTAGAVRERIAIDPTNPNHAFLSFSGYEAYTPGQPGHVFEVTFHPGTGNATWTDISSNIGDQPVTDVAFDDQTGDIYVDGLQRPSARGRRQHVGRGGRGPAGRDVRPHDRHVGRGPGAVRGHARPRRLVGRAALGRRRQNGSREGRPEGRPSSLAIRDQAGFVTVAANSSRLST